MRIIIYSTKPYDEASLSAACPADHELVFIKPRLEPMTASLAKGYDAICAFVNDIVDREVLTTLHEGGVKLVTMRCAGFNNVDIEAAAELGLTVARVPEYSPFSVAEHTIGMMLSLNRHLHRAYNRVREGNFALEGLLGFDMHGRTAGVIGTGKIGRQVCRILLGLGCRVIAFDRHEDAELVTTGVVYRQLDELFSESDIVTLHCPLLPETFHLINSETLNIMKPGVMLINTSRGALLDTGAVLQGLKSGKIGHLGLDVYEEEAELFFEDRSGAILQDDVFARLLTFSNVLITGHQAFFTRDALQKIAAVTMENFNSFAESGHVPPANKVA